MTGTLLFDLFGVIARDQSAEGQRELARVADVDGAARDAFWEAYWRLRPPYDQGLFTGPEYWKSVAAELDTGFSEQQLTDLIAADIGSWSAVDDAMVDLLGELSASGWDLALLSNCPEELTAHYEARHAWLGRFRLRAFSCRIGHVKPQAAAFGWCVAELGVPTRQILFVDDRRENVEAAVEAGLRGHVFTGRVRLREQLGTH